MIDRMDSVPHAAAAARRQIVVFNRSLSEQQVEQLEGYMNDQGSQSSEGVG